MQRPTLAVPAAVSRLAFCVRSMTYRALGRLDLLRGRVNPGPFVLCYHSVSSRGWRFSVRLEALRDQLEELTATHTPITACQLEDFVRGSARLPDRSFAVTFDDGYRDVLDGEPLCRSLGVRPTLFALAHPERASADVTEAGLEFLSYAELRHLHEAGWEIGCHSSTHPDLTVLSESDLTSEVFEAKQRLEAVLGDEVRYFAYPKGRYNARVAAACAAAGYQLAFSMDDGVLRSGANGFALPRIGVDGSHSLAEFRCLMSPLPVALRGTAKFILGLQARPCLGGYDSDWKKRLSASPR